MKFNPNQIVRKCDFQHHTKCNPDLIIGSVKCFDLYIFLLVFISKDLGYKQICWTILVNLCPTSGTVLERFDVLVSHLTTIVPKEGLPHKQAF